MLRLLALGVIVLSTSGCKDRGDPLGSDLLVADSNALAGIVDHQAPAGKGPDDVLTEHERRASLFGAHCGVGNSKIRLFDPAKIQQTNWAWFEEKSARQWGAPSFQKTCAAGETYEASDDFCWAPYQLQMFPVASSPAVNHYLVAGTSPVMRVFPEASYPSVKEACRFDNDTALIFVAGVNNPYLGESWKTTDKELLASLFAWNRNRPEQSPGNVGKVFRRKMTERPGYIQIVGNANSKADGVFGAHNEPAIELMIRNLELAFRSGVSRLEVVSHSNGMITVQAAIAEFSRQLAVHGTTWLAERKSANPGAGKIRLHVFHLQAAPSQKWSRHRLDKYDNYSDFLPNARWEKKSSLGVPYWGWEWDFNGYTNLEAYASMNIDYFYNAPDRWTYPWTSSVGRTVSIKWHEEVQNEAYQRGVKSTVSHNVCEDKDEAVCGPGHSQKDVLWDFANPGFVQDMRLIDWRTDFRSGPLASVGVSPQGMQETAPQRQIRRAAAGLPELICLDIRNFEDQCKKLFASQDAPATVAEERTTMPALVCAAKADQQSICRGGICGDGICSLGEAANCNVDCKVPDTYESCSCIGAICNAKDIGCTDGVCGIKDATPVSGCQCQSAQGIVKCDVEELNCEILNFSGHCVKKMSEPFHDGPGAGSLHLDSPPVVRVFQR